MKKKVTPALLAGLAVSILIFILYYVNSEINYGASAILFAAFGASAFILFMTPKLKSARPGTFIKAYVLGGIIGVIGFYVSALLPFWLVAGAAVFVLSLLMYAADSPHPPAIGIALAFVLYKIDVLGILIVMLGVVILLLLRFVLERFVFIIEKDIANDI